MAAKFITEPSIPAWCKPQGWVYHLPSNAIFQAQRLQIDRASNQLYLRDDRDHEFLVSECEELTPRTLTSTALIAGTQIQVHPQKNGLLLTKGKTRLLVKITPAPTEAESAAQSLAQLFKGVIYTEEVS